MICKQLNDSLGIGIAHRKIGEALNELGQYENALKHQQKYLSKFDFIKKFTASFKTSLM